MATVVLKTSLCLPSEGLFLGQTKMETVFDSISLFAFQDLNSLNFDKLRQILFLLTLLKLCILDIMNLPWFCRT